MLVTKITYSSVNNTFTDFSSPYIKKYEHNYYKVFPEKLDKQIADVKVNDNLIEISFLEDLELKEYILLHEVIKSIQLDVKGTIDDSNSFLGYTELGERAYIIRNWSKWIGYVHESMKNCQ
ncbi:hypothetical protein BC6307_18240 [Sutcliffiella cohnii]|uniref:Uncharacterized protein n=1 Tax=Sutcliffiella cohnii TaxID=33932 RepID=A0A223KUP5_9BACI|nr:hypothetical protein [Sutcliffiella cohnii]AST93058.1 hypothetical protein BC6307_18240 [Sutcliffiella cohnii]